ncbi:amino acid permease/ SLC12A domain-containing protein [Trametes maxima]|nr:amino acid permease/ SLC12A domain-containing protein [Trametes maxima]
MNPVVYNWSAILPTEVSAVSGVVIDYWNKSVNDAVWITLCIVVVITMNHLGAGAYREAEFIFCPADLKTIPGLFVLCVVSTTAADPTSTALVSDARRPGRFAQFDDIDDAKGSLGVVAAAGAEPKNPQRNIPKTIKRVYLRLLLFYVGSVAIIGLLVPSNDPRLDLADGAAAAHSLVIAIGNVGIKVPPLVNNASILTSAWSVTDDLYDSFRALYGLAPNGNAPKLFLKVTRHGLS